MSESNRIESPSGLDLHPKPPEPTRVSKRAGALVRGIAILVLGLFAYGGRRQRIQQMTVADLGANGVGPATSAGSEVAKDVPSGSVPLARRTDPTTPELVPPGEVTRAGSTTAPATGSVVVRQLPKLGGRLRA